jgi:hypothetical protein
MKKQPVGFAVAEEVTGWWVLAIFGRGASQQWAGPYRNRFGAYPDRDRFCRLWAVPKYVIKGEGDERSYRVLRRD